MEISSVVELQQFRERDIKRKLAQQKYRDALKTRRPKPTEETAEQLAVKKEILDAKKKQYQCEYALRRRTNLCATRENTRVAKQLLQSRYLSGELLECSKEELLDMLMSR